MITNRGNNARRLRLQRRRSRRRAGDRAFAKKFRKFLAEALKSPRRILFTTLPDGQEQGQIEELEL